MLTPILLPAVSALAGSIALGLTGWLGVETVREHRERRIAVPNALSDLVKWSALVAPGVVLNKNGSFQTTFRYRGPDLDSSTESELVSTSARLNNIVRRLGSGWAVYFDAVRRETTAYPNSRFPDPLSALIDEERRERRESDAEPEVQRCTQRDPEPVMAGNAFGVAGAAHQNGARKMRPNAFR